MRLFRVDVEESVAHLVGVAHRVEDEELGLGAEERLLGDAAGLEEGLGAARDAARVAGVGLHRGRVEHVAGQHQGGIGGEGIEEGGVRVGSRTMSEFWMPRQPPIEEPSNILPSSNRPGSTIDFG